MPGEAPEPAGLKRQEQDTILTSENVQLRLRLQRLQGQLQQQHLHQVSHCWCYIQHLIAYKWTALATHVLACLDTIAC